MTGRLGLRGQIALGTAALIAIQGLASIVLLDWTLNAEMSAQLDARTQAKAIQLAELAVDRVVSGRRLTLGLLVSEYASSSPEIEYAYVLDARGIVLAHSFTAGFPADLLDDATEAKPGEARVRKLATERGLVHEASAPMLEGTAGSVHVGLSATETRRVLRRIIAWFMAVMAAVLLVGSAATAWFALRISRPIVAAAEAARALAAGRMDTRVRVEATGEVAELGRAFNEMAADLQRSKEAILTAKETNENVLHSLHDALFVLSPDAVIRQANPAACGLLGYAAEELEGRPAGSLLAPGIGVEELLGTYRNVETGMLSKDGAQVPVLLSATVMRGSQGQVAGVVWAARPR